MTDEEKKLQEQDELFKYEDREEERLRDFDLDNGEISEVCEDCGGSFTKYNLKWNHACMRVADSDLEEEENNIPVTAENVDQIIYPKEEC